MRPPKQQAGFTLIEIMIVVLLVGMLAAIAVPNFIRSRTSAQTNVCINNLRAIDFAIQQWAMEQKKGANAPVQFADISAYLRNVVTCPAGGASFADSYLISTVGVEPICQRAPSAHLILVAGSSDSGNPNDPTGSPASQGPSAPGPSSGNGNNGNGNNGNGNGNGNGGIGNGNGNGNTP